MPKQNNFTTNQACPEDPVAVVCHKSKNIYSGLENTALSWRFFYDVDITNSDGSITTVTLPASTGWGPQMIAWQAALAEAYPDVCEVSLVWWEWRDAFLPNTGLGALPPAAFDFPAARGQFIQFCACPGDVIPVGAVVVNTDHPKRLSYNLVAGTGEGEETRSYDCVECGDETDACDCSIGCDEVFPETPQPLCSTTVVPGCDDLDTESPDDDVDIVAVYTDCGDGITVNYFTDDGEGNLEDYELVGTFLPFCKECEVVDFFKQCDANCRTVEFVRKLCGGVVIVEGPFVVGTDIEDKEAKGPFVDCPEKNYINEKCYTSTDYAYTWDNGVARNPLDGTPLGYPPASTGNPYDNRHNTPFGEVLASPANGFIDKLLTCGTATIDEILVEGQNIVTAPVTVPSGPNGSWINLNRVLWQTIAAQTGQAFPAGIGCERNIGNNCYGRSITCADVELESFKVTDCKGGQWEFSIERETLGTTEYTAHEYLDCKGEKACDWYIGKDLLDVEPELVCLVQCPCTPEKESDEEPCTKSYDIVCTQPLEYSGTLTGYRWNTEGNAINGNPGGFENTDISDVWTATDADGLPAHPNPFDDQLVLSPPMISMTETNVIAGEDPDNYLIEGYVIIPAGVSTITLEGYGGGYGWEAFYIGADPSSATLVAQGTQFSAQSLFAEFDVSELDVECDDTKCFWFRHYSDDSNGAAFIFTRMSMDGAPAAPFNQAGVNISETKPEPIETFQTITVPCGDVPIGSGLVSEIFTPA